MDTGFVIDRCAWQKVVEQLVLPPFQTKDVFAKFVSDRICQRTPARIEDLVSFLEECRKSNPTLFEYLQQRVSASILKPVGHVSGLDALSQTDQHLPVLEPEPPNRTLQTIVETLNRSRSEYALSTRSIHDYRMHVESHSIELTYGDPCDVKELFRRYRQYSKSLIIADPYLFNDRFAIQLRAFIDALIKMPSKTHIVILTSDFRHKNSRETDYSAFKDLNLEIRFVNRFVIKDEMHDRWVIADWTAFHVGAGLDSFITGQIENTTTIQVQPRLASTHKTYDEARAHHEWLAEDEQSSKFVFR